MNWLASMMEGLPRLSADFVRVGCGLFFILVLAGFLYGQRLGQRAVDNGRAKRWFGQVSNFAVQQELWREAKTGGGIARFVLVMQICLPIVFVVLFFWPKDAAQ